MYDDPRARQQPTTGQQQTRPGGRQPGPAQNPSIGSSDQRGSTGSPPPQGVQPWSGPLPAGAPAANMPSQFGPQPSMPAMPGPTFNGFDPNATGGAGAQPVGFNGGYYNPTTAAFGFDMSQPGMDEQFWANNQNLWMQTPQLDWINSQLPQFNNPWFGETWNQGNMGGIGAAGAGQQYWNGISGSANQMTPAQQATRKGYQDGNSAKAAFELTGKNLPGSMEGNFDSYYDRMKDKVMSDVNAQSAARGSYGSNTSLNNTIGAGLDIEAQRAKAKTDFDFQDSQNQLNWLNSYAQQGRASDLSGIGILGANANASATDLDRIKTMGDLAFRAEEMDYNKKKTMSDIAFDLDDHKRNRMDSGVSAAFGLDSAYGGRLDRAFGAAGQAEGARQNRINSLNDRVTDFSNDTMNFFSENYDKLLGGDTAMSEQELEAMIAQAADQRGWDTQQQERIFRDAKAIMDAINGKKAAGAGATPTV